MISVRKIVFGVAVAAGLAASASPAFAWGPLMTTPGGCSGPFCNQARYPTLGSYLFRGHNTKLPVFQAAPWYLYWPYDAHFLTPAPVHGAFYGPPVPGNFPVNPYFPGPGYPAAYGPVPGGPPPSMVPPPGYPTAPPPTGYPTTPPPPPAGTYPR
jgi:hypothetical protein